jgi:hypothetical protein
MERSARRETVALLVLAVTSCGGGKSAVPAGARVAPVLAAALDMADRVRSPWRCAAPDGLPLADEKLAVGDRAWTASGHTVRLDGKGEVVIGAIADAGGAAPATIAALGRLHTKLAKADVVIALGGMGTTQAELEATLGAIADKAYPIVALPGDLEAVSAQTAAITALRGKGLVVIDGRLARRVKLPGVTIATIPGSASASRLVAGAEGCGYRAADVTIALAELTPHPGLRILASAEAPREITGGEPSGERSLTAATGQEIDVALHGPSTEAASRARTGARNGDAVALTPGTSDATARLPGPAHPPSAGLLTIHGTTWTWKPITDDE